MKIDPTWRRIAGLYVKDDGLMAAVWIAHDGESDITHLYDCCSFGREVVAVITDGLNARGRWVPIAWEKSAKEISDELYKRGCNMLKDPVLDSDAFAEITTREILIRIRTGRFKVNDRLQDWLEELKTYNRSDSKVPRESHPLMTATRLAIAGLKNAKAERKPVASNKRLYPKIAIV